jgi:hypothetical protein
MLIECYVKGAVVGVNDGTTDANPFEPATEAHTDWLVGYHAGGTAAKRMRGERLPATGAGKSNKKTKSGRAAVQIVL